MIIKMINFGLIVLFKEKTLFKVLGDINFSPLLVNSFVQILHQSIEADLKGMYHFGSKDYVSKYKFIKMMAKKFNMPSSLINKYSVFDIDLVAKRPHEMYLNSGKFFKDLDLYQK